MTEELFITNKESFAYFEFHLIAPHTFYPPEFENICAYKDENILQKN